jgi:hypothetical protein
MPYALILTDNSEQSRFASQRRRGKFVDAEDRRTPDSQEEQRRPSTLE